MKKNFFRGNGYTKKVQQTSMNVRRDFWFFITNYRSTLVLYEKPKDEKTPEPVKFHIYTKLNKTQYTLNGIYTLLEKYRPILDACYFEFNKDFVGNYVMYDDIYEEFKYSFFNLKHAYDGHDVYDDPLIYAVNEPVRE